MYNVDQPSLYLWAHLDVRAVPPYTTWIDVARHNKWYGRD
jgi:hypothetical protein